VELKTLKIGWLVENKNGKVGAIVSNPFGYSPPGKVPVVWDNEDIISEVSPENIQSIGIYKAEADPEKCRDCMYFDEKKVACLRFEGDERWRCFYNNSIGKRRPKSLYPACQAE